MKSAAEGALVSGRRAETVAFGRFRVSAGCSFGGCGNFDDAMGGHILQSCRMRENEDT